MKRAVIDLNLDPRVYTVDNFVSASECAHLIARAKAEGMKRAVVAGSAAGIVSVGRTNSVCWVDHMTDMTTRRIAERTAGLIGMPLSHAERFQLIHYGEGAEYRPHFDAFDPRSPAGKRTWKNGGQRLITALGYLNTPLKGGGTVFPKLKLMVPAEAGKLVVFHNCEPGTTTRHTLGLHGGTPVEQGEKWAFNLWFRANSRK